MICCVAIIALSSYKLNKYRYEVKLRTEYSEKYGEVLEQIRERQHKFSNQLERHLCPSPALSYLRGTGRKAERTDEGTGKIHNAEHRHYSQKSLL